MRFIHLSDLHIGKKLYNFSLLDDQSYIFNQIIDLIKNEEIDGIFISGDIFDRSNPAEDGVVLYTDFINKLRGIAPVFIIAGNHDSGTRLEIFNDRLKKDGIYIEGTLKEKVAVEKIEKEDEVANIYLLPFISPFNSKRKDLSYQDFIKNIFDSITINSNEINILLSHQLYLENFGGEIGTIPSLPLSLLNQFDYVALGHIHKRQKLNNRVYQVGSPLSYKLENETKSFNLIEITKDQIDVKKVELKPRRKVRTVTGNFEKLSKESSEDYVFIELTDNIIIPQVKEKLLLNYPNLLGVKYLTLLEEQENKEINLEKSTSNIIEDFFESKHLTLNDGMKDILDNLIEEIQCESKN